MSSLFAGNAIEEYILPLQFAAVALLLALEKRPDSRLLAFLIGLMGGAAFLMRQNLIGTWIGVGIYLAAQRARMGRWRTLAATYGWMVVGALSMVLVPVLYFSARGVLGEMWEAAFRYNVLYSAEREGLLFRMATLFVGHRRAIFLLCSTGWVIALARRRLGLPSTDEGETLARLLVVVFPIELAMSSISGRAYLHYFLPWLPVLGISVCLVLSVLYRTTIARIHNPLVQRIAAGLPLTALAIVALVRGGTSLASAFESRSEPDEVLSLILQTTTEDDYVLIWGGEPQYNFLAHRRSPTRYHFQYPPLRNFASAEMRAELLGDLVRTKPALIIDTSSRGGIVPIVDIPDTLGLEELESMVRTEYRYEGTLGPEHWPVYRHIEE
jgi:hypothetical protein